MRGKYFYFQRANTRTCVFGIALILSTGSSVYWSQAHAHTCAEALSKLLEKPGNIADPHARNLLPRSETTELRSLPSFVQRDGFVQSTYGDYFLAHQFEGGAVNHVKVFAPLFFSSRKGEVTTTVSASKILDLSLTAPTRHPTHLGLGIRLGVKNLLFNMNSLIQTRIGKDWIHTLEDWGHAVFSKSVIEPT
jgi:hypothetical protein